MSKNSLDFINGMQRSAQRTGAMHGENITDPILLAAVRDKKTNVLQLPYDTTIGISAARTFDHNLQVAAMQTQIAEGKTELATYGLEKVLAWNECFDDEVKSIAVPIKVEKDGAEVTMHIRVTCPDKFKIKDEEALRNMKDEIGSATFSSLFESDTSYEFQGADAYLAIVEMLKDLGVKNPAKRQEMISRLVVKKHTLRTSDDYAKNLKNIDEQTRAQIEKFVERGTPSVYFPK